MFWAYTKLDLIWQHFFQSNEFQYHSDKKTVDMEIPWKIGFPKSEGGSCMKAYARSGNWANEPCDGSSSYIICESVLK